MNYGIISHIQNIMGCGITAFIEYSFTQSDGSKEFVYWNLVPLDRNYTLFALMANVRNRAKIEPVSLPKRVPQGLSEQVQDRYEYDREHYCAGENHSHSWLSLQEIREVQRRYCNHFDDDEPDLLLNAIMSVMQTLEQEGKEESRLVFWFDN